MTTPDDTPAPPARTAVEQAIIDKLGERSIVLVGLMGAGKSSVGKRLAQRMHLPFVDADTAIEQAAGLTIPEIFARFGETDFRSGERRVIARLLKEGPQVLATGGGAYMSEETRQRIRENGVSVWLKAEFDVLMRRVRRRADRPLLKNSNPEETMRKLIDERYPVYAEADLTIISTEVAHDIVVQSIVEALTGHLDSAAIPS